MDPLTLAFILFLVVVLIVIYQFRHVISFIRYRWMLKSVEKKVEESKPKLQLLCPVCGEPMEKGYVVGSGGLYWSEDIPPYSYGMPFPGPEFISEPLAPQTLPYSRRASILKAYRCRKCGVIRIDIKDQNFGLI